MKKRGAYGLLLGFCCSSLAAQQVLVSASAPAAMGPIAVHAATSASPAAGLRHGVPVSHTSFIVGLPANRGFASGIQPLPGDEVCTQADAPLVTPAAAPAAGVVVAAAVPPATAAESEYAFERLQFNRAAITGTLRHDNLVKMARNFVPGQPLPDAPSYVPLTAQQKFDLFVRKSHSPDMGISILLDSFISQASGGHPAFGGGMEGYGKRLGAAAAGEETAAFVGGFLFPTLLHQDPRYFPSRQNSISQRMAYAASRVLIGRSDDGRNVINASVILSQFVQSAIANAYIPYRNPSVSHTMENALAGLGVVAQSNLLTEFWPDIKTFFSRHNPESLLRHDHPDHAPASEQLADRGGPSSK